MNYRTAILTLLVLLPAGVCAAGSWHVEQDGSGDFTKLQPAVDAAASGDTILVGPGLYQDYERVLLGVRWYRIMAYWDIPKDLVFIGAGVGLTTLGPDQFESGPTVEYFEGIKSYLDGNDVTVTGIGFQNFHIAVAGFGSSTVTVNDCRFENGYIGVQAYGGSARVEQCEFRNQGVGVGAFFCASAIVADCTFDNAKAYFGDTIQGDVIDCVALDGALVQYYHSNGTVSGNVASCGENLAAIYVSAASVVSVLDNQIDGGAVNLYVTDGNTTVTAVNNIFDNPAQYNVMVKSEASLYAHGNDIFRGVFSPFLVKTESYGPGTTAVVDMSGNHWGESSDEFTLSWRIYDSGEDPDIHLTVEYLPIEGAPVPTEATSWGTVKSMFR